MVGHGALRGIEREFLPAHGEGACVEDLYERRWRCPASCTACDSKASRMPAQSSARGRDLDDARLESGR